MANINLAQAPDTLSFGEEDDLDMGETAEPEIAEPGDSVQPAAPNFSTTAPQAPDEMTFSVDPDEVAQKQPSANDKFNQSAGTQGWIEKNIVQPPIAAASNFMEEYVTPYTDRPPRAIGAFISEAQDRLKEAPDDPFSAFNSAMYEAWEQLKGSKVPTLRFGDIVESNLLSAGADPTNARDLGTIAGFTVDGAADGMNLVAPAIGAIVKGGGSLQRMKFLDKATQKAEKVISGLRSPAAKRAEQNMMTLGIADSSSPTLIDRAMANLAGVSDPAMIMHYRNHMKRVDDATDIVSLGEDVENAVVIPFQAEYQKVRQRLDDSKALADTAKKSALSNIAKSADPEYVAAVFAQKVKNLKDKASDLSTVGYKVLRESGATMPIDDILEVVNDFKFKSTNGTGIPDPDLAPVFGLVDNHVRVLAEQYMDMDGIPLDAVKDFLQNKLHYNRLGNVGPGLTAFEKGPQRQYKQFFHSALNRKMKDALPDDAKEVYINLMQEAEKISDFIEKNESFVKDHGAIERSLKSIGTTYKPMSQTKAVAEKTALQDIIELTGDESLRDTLRSFETTQKLLMDDVSKAKYIESLPESQLVVKNAEAMDYADAMLENMRGISPTNTGGGIRYVESLARRPVSSYNQYDLATIDAINGLMEESTGKPFNLVTAVIDSKVKTALSMGRQASGKGGSHNVQFYSKVFAAPAGAATVAAKLFGIGADPTMLAGATIALYGAGAAVGKAVDTWGPAVAGGYVRSMAHAGKIGIKGTGISLGKMPEVIDTLIKVAPGYLDQLLNKEGELLQNGYLTVTDDTIKGQMRTAILSAKTIDNKEKAKLINQIRQGTFTFELGENPYEKIAEFWSAKEQDPTKPADYRDMLNIHGAPAAQGLGNLIKKIKPVIDQPQN